MPKNIVICSDGTGQSYAGAESNVLRLYRYAIKRSDDQIARYDPGVGTLPVPAARTRLGRAVRRGAELGLGLGVIDNVVELYAYLMRSYEPGDRIYLFGFSRGAFTVRALAGMLHVCGLLRPDDEHLLKYAAGLYQTSERRIRRVLRAGTPAGSPPRSAAEPGPVDHARHDDEARRFKSLFSRDCTVAFLGVWDTVKAYGWIWPQSFPALRHNPDVLAVRHAVALDERRSSFQVTGWGDRHRDVKEVWFRGDHSDVGGGHPGESVLADAALAWMLGEATAAGLRLDPAHKGAVATVVANAGAGSPRAPHDLRRRWRWALLEMCPRLELDNRDYPPRRRFRCWPTGLRRPVQHAEGAAVLVHESVVWDQASAAAAVGVRRDPVRSEEIRWWVPDGDASRARSAARTPPSDRSGPAG